MVEMIDVIGGIWEGILVGRMIMLLLIFNVYRRSNSGMCMKIVGSNNMKILFLECRLSWYLNAIQN